MPNSSQLGRRNSICLAEMGFSNGRTHPMGGAVWFIVATVRVGRRTVRPLMHRLAAALEVHGFVGRAEDGRFQRGDRLSQPALTTVSRLALQQLRDATSESVQLYVRRGTQRLCVQALESPHGLRTIVPVGALLPLDRGSAGRVLAGVGGDEWVESVEERQKGVASVSAAVRDPRDEVIA